MFISRILELNLGLNLELTDSGPPEKITPLGFNFKSSFGVISHETISDKTPISLLSFWQLAEYIANQNQG